MKTTVFAALLGASAIGLGVSLLAPEAKAICLPTDPGPCATFDPSTPSRVIQSTSPTGLSQIQHLQAGVAANQAGRTVSQVAYSTVNPLGNFNAASFQPLQASLTTLAGSAISAGTPLTLAAPLGVSTLWVRYQIDSSPLAFTPGDVVQLSLYGNKNGYLDPGYVDPVSGQQLLGNDGSNDFFANTIQSDAVRANVPGPLPALGAAAAFGASRRIRRRLKVAA